jgi:adenylate cyclase
MKQTLEQWLGVSKRKVTLAIVFTDIVGSTKLGLELGDDKWIDVLIKHFEQARDLIKAFDCYEIKIIGDSFMVVFRTADEALKFALAFQENTGDSRIRIRVGIHVGAVRIIENDIYGSAVNFTARVVGWPREEWIALSNYAKTEIESAWGTEAPVEFVKLTPKIKNYPKREPLWGVVRKTPPTTKEAEPERETSGAVVMLVLPFRPAELEAPGHNYMGQIIADAIIMRLGAVPQIIVRPTSAINEYNEEDYDPLAVGREQKADIVLYGEYRREGEHVRVTVHRLRVQDGTIISTETFEVNDGNQ